MSFAEDVKNELCQYKNEDSLSAKVEASCLLRMGGSLLLGSQGRVGIRLATANNAVARRVLSILRAHYALHTSVLIRRGLNLRKKNVYTLTVEPTVEGREALEDMALWPMDTALPAEWLTTMEGRRAFLRGAFLGGGSVNKPESDYHLEFMTSNQHFADEIVRVLRLFHIGARVTERKDSYVVYIKEGDAVTDCLQIMGAQSALMEFETVRVVKTVRNQINRQVNCETANLQKTVNAAVRQLESIRIIERHQELSDLPPKLLEVAMVRLDNPDASLGELVDLLGGHISKSGVGHRFRKLEQLALSYEPMGLEEFM